jgi:hypothetical protein
MSVNKYFFVYHLSYWRQFNKSSTVCVRACVCAHFRDFILKTQQWFPNMHEHCLTKSRIVHKHSHTQPQLMGLLLYNPDICN